MWWNLIRSAQGDEKKCNWDNSISTLISSLNVSNKKSIEGEWLFSIFETRVQLSYHPYYCLDLNHATRRTESDSCLKSDSD